MDGDTAAPRVAQASVDLDRLYRANVRRVYGLARNRVGPQAAVDVTAEVFLAASQAVATGATEITTGWLLQVTRHKAADHWRRRYRADDRAHIVHLVVDPCDRPPPIEGDDENGPAVLAALDELTELDRSLLMLHHVDGIPIADLAAALGRSVSATTSALARARRRFRRHYRTEGRHA